ncbi:MAG: sigma-70 family RNA polymerase sigma factor [Clostridiales bacterium]|nr:sigma-70 family RNA polymerase sigma factor [Clostridiales bacterium]
MPYGKPRGRKREERWIAVDTCGMSGFAHEGLAVACARRFTGRGIPMEELLQEARTALVAAAARFDPGRGLRFSTYAVPVVLGALRALCRRAAPMYVPRAEGRLLAEAYDRDAEKAEARSKDPRLSAALAAAERMRHLTADPELAALAKEDGFEDRVLLRDAVRRLGQPHAQVIGLRYLCGLTQRQVGERLRAAQWQVCRWEQQGLERLRAELGDSGG